MTSEFNSRSVREQYADFDGRIKEQMSALLADNRYPMFTREVADERLAGRGLDRDVDVGDLITYNGKGDQQEIRFILTANRSGLTETGKFALGLINPHSTYTGTGALNLAEARDIENKVVSGAYDAINGDGVISVKRKDIGTINERLKGVQSVLDHKGWRILLRHPDEVPKEFAEDWEGAKEYVEKVVFSKYDEAMGMYLSNGEKVPILRAFCVDWLDDNCGSGAYDGDRLDDDNGRLVGVAPEAPIALGKNDQSVKPYSLADLAEFDEALAKSNGVVAPELLDKFRKVRSKL